VSGTAAEIEWRRGGIRNAVSIAESDSALNSYDNRTIDVSELKQIKTGEIANLKSLSF